MRPESYAKEYESELETLQCLTASEFSAMSEDDRYRLYSMVTYHTNNMVYKVIPEGDFDDVMHASDRFTDLKCMYKTLCGLTTFFEKRLETRRALLEDVRKKIGETESMTEITNLGNKGYRIEMQMRLYEAYLKILNAVAAGCDAMIRGWADVNRSTVQAPLDDYIEVVPPTKPADWHITNCG